MSALEETAIWRSRVATAGGKSSSTAVSLQRLSWQSVRPKDHKSSASLTGEDVGLIAGSGTNGSDRQGQRRLYAARSTMECYTAFQSRYELREVLGSGGCSDVFLGQQRSLSREVAIKVGGIEGGRKTARFRTEAILTSHLDHPNIVPVYDAGDCFLVMKRVRGASLQQLIETSWPDLDLPRFVDVLVQVSNAIAFAHHRGVIHRDLKAANIMVGEFGEVLLLDWGLSWCFGPLRALIGDQDTMSDVISGTPACMAPEIAQGQVASNITPACDVFCLGAMLYMLLCADMPFTEDDPFVSLKRAATNDYQRLGTRRPNAPASLVALQEQAMATDPKLRPSAETFRDGLRRWLLRAGNEPEAAKARTQAQKLLQEAESCHHKDWERQFRCFVQSIAAFDRALSLCPETTDLAQERATALDHFIRAALRAGSYQLARMLSQGVVIPV